MSELKIDSERGLKASESCPQAKEILKTLFPEVFEEKEEWEDVTKNITFRKALVEKKDIQYVPVLGESANFLCCEGNWVFLLIPVAYHVKDYKMEGDKLWRLKE